MAARKKRSDGKAGESKKSDTKRSDVRATHAETPRSKRATHAETPRSKRATHAETPRSKRRSAAPPAKTANHGRSALWLYGGALAFFAVVAAVVVAQRGPVREHATNEAPEATEVTTVSQAATGAVVIPEALRVRVVERRPHDPDAFTQGLLVHEGELYESTGLE